MVSAMYEFVDNMALPKLPRLQAGTVTVQAVPWLHAVHACSRKAGRPASRPADRRVGAEACDHDLHGIPCRHTL